MGLFDRFKKKPAEPERKAKEEEKDEDEDEEEQAEEEAEDDAEPPRAAGKADGSEWYRAGDVAVFSLGEDQDAVYSADSREVHLLPDFVTGLLRRCVTFETLDDHTAELGAALRMGAQEQAALRRHLQTLQKKGLLRSHRDLVVRAAERDRGTPPPRVEVVGVVGGNRPELASTLGREVVAIDADARRALAERLVAAGAERRLVDFALESDRNALLLRAAGKMCIAIDAAATGRAGDAPEIEEGLALSSLYNPTELHFHHDVDEACAAVDFDEDLVAGHEKLLGRSLAACVKLHDTGEAIDLDLDDASSDLLHRYATGRSAVVVTVAGICGDLGAASPGTYLALTGHQRDRLLAEYEKFRLTRAVVRAARRATITDSPFFQGVCVGLDGRDPLPPFCPGAEEAYGTALAAARRHGCVGHLALAVEHRPARAPTTVDEDLVKWACEATLLDAVTSCLQTASRGSGVVDPAERVRALGHHLRAVAALAPEDFDQYLRLQHVQLLAGRATWLHDSLRSHDEEPAAWAEDVERVLTALTKAIADPKLGRVEGAQLLVARYGELCVAWPDLLAAARE